MNLADEYDASIIAQARAIASSRTIENYRAILRDSTLRDYTDADPGTVQAALFGRAQSLLDQLAAMAEKNLQAGAQVYAQVHDQAGDQAGAQVGDHRA